jgi:hypothetical protein
LAQEINNGCNAAQPQPISVANEIVRDWRGENPGPVFHNQPNKTNAAKALRFLLLLRKSS